MNPEDDTSIFPQNSHNDTEKIVTISGDVNTEKDFVAGNKVRLNSPTYRIDIAIGNNNSTIRDATINIGDVTINNNYPPSPPLEGVELTSKLPASTVSPSTGQILGTFDNSSEKLDEIHDLLLKLSDRFPETSSIVRDGTNKDLESSDKAIHAVIDSYRDLIITGKQHTALELLLSFKDKNWSITSDRVRFRLETNIGSAKLHMSKEKAIEAAAHFLEAVKYQPEDKIALANVALAYLLRGEPSSAIDVAKFALQKDSENVDAASHLIRAHFGDASLENPLFLIPESTRNSAPVLAACVYFYRLQNNALWVEIAKNAGLDHPNDDYVARLAAEADLESIFAAKGLLVGQSLFSSISLESLRQAAAVLQRLWEKQYESEVPYVDSSLPFNLIQAYRAIGNITLAETVAKQAIEKIPDSCDLIRLRAEFFVHEGKTQEALSLLRKGSNDSECLLMTAELLVGTDPVAILKTLENFEHAEHSEPHYPIIAAGYRIDALLAHPQLSRDERLAEAVKEYSKLFAQYPNSPITLIIYSKIHDANGDDLAAKQVLSSAKSILTKDSPFFERFLLAQRFSSLECHSDVADILDGYVEISHDNPALRMLFISLIKGNRRYRAHDVLKLMPNEVALQPLYLRAALILHQLRGDYPKAFDISSELIAINPKDVEIHLIRIDIWLRYREDETVERFLLTEVEQLEGNPAEMMRLAQCLARFGFFERAFKLGYRIYSENYRNPDVQVSYVGLFMPPTFSTQVDLQRNIVELDTAITVRNSLGETETFIIEDDDDLRPTEKHIPSRHPYAAAAFGLKVNERFTVKNNVEWEITSIEHKFIYSSRLILEQFDRLYPENDSLQRFIVKDIDGVTDFEPMLQKAKQRHDAIELLFNTYSKSPFPLESLAKRFGSNSLEVWQGLVQSGRRFRVCKGDLKERELALQDIINNNKAGCVLDALTFYLVRVLEIEDIVLQICGPLSITESSIDVFRFRRERLIPNRNEPFMTVFWRDGELFREEMSADMVKQSLDHLNGELDWIDQNVDVLMAESQYLLSEEMLQISEIVPHWFFDPLLAAQSSNRLLLCEDLQYRLLGVKNFNLRSSWLQPVLMLALEQKLISANRYQKLLCQLVEMRHNFTAIDIGTLLYALSKSDTEIKIVTDILFDADAELISHLRVMVMFLDRIWDRKRPSLNRIKATNHLLRRLFFGEWVKIRPEMSPSTILAILRRRLQNPHFNRYLSSWEIGHIMQ